MASPIKQAIQVIVEEKGLSYEAVMEAIESALAAAFRKDFGHKNQNLVVEFDVDTGGVNVFDVKTVVEDMEIEEEEEQEEGEERKEKSPESRVQSPVKDEKTKDEEVDEDEEEEDEEPKFNPKTDMMLTAAREIKDDAEIGDVIRTELEVPGDFGRMAAQTAKQVITQKLREAEREIIYNEYKDKEGQVLIGTVQRREGRIVLVDIGRATGILRSEDQVPGERYSPGNKIKVYVRQVGLTTKGPEILLSRTVNELVEELFYHFQQ